MSFAPDETANEQRSTAPVAVDVVIDGGGWQDVLPEDRLAASVTAAVEAVSAVADVSDWPGKEVTVALSDDTSVAALNGQFRGKAKPTNVLSFPPGPGGPPGILGDIVLAFETVVREAAEQDIPVDHHLSHLVVHGVLHLIGYDHETPDEAAEMEALEVAILDRLGIANPYEGRDLEA